MSTKVILENVRCSYVYVDKVNKHDKYGIQVLIPKSDKKQLTKIENAVSEELLTKFGKGASNKLGKYKLPIRDGDLEQDGEEYEGMIFFNANNTKKPGIVNRRGEVADLDDISECCYSGAYFHASVEFYPFTSQDGGKPGIAASIINIMLRKQGERLDGRVSATTEFADFINDDDDDDFDDL